MRRRIYYLPKLERPAGSGVFPCGGFDEESFRIGASGLATDVPHHDDGRGGHHGATSEPLPEAGDAPRTHSSVGQRIRGHGSEFWFPRHQSPTVPAARPITEADQTSLSAASEALAKTTYSYESRVVQNRRAHPVGHASPGGLSSSGAAPIDTLEKCEPLLGRTSLAEGRGTGGASEQRTAPYFRRHMRLSDRQSLPFLDSLSRRIDF